MVPALWPAVAILSGTAAGIACPTSWRWLLWSLPALATLSFVAWLRHARIAVAGSVVAFGIAGFILGADAREKALHTPIRAEDLASSRNPITARLLLSEDASLAEGLATLRGRVTAIRRADGWTPSDGGVVVTIGGANSGRNVEEWRRGRTIEAPIAFRRPARYLNDGVPDFELQAALDGISLLGSIKSALLVSVVEHGTLPSEIAADIRAHVRQVMARRVGVHSALSSAIVTAVLIGDRSGLPDAIRDRLQTAGTYHVIAISGGNIAILATLIVVLLVPVGVSGRRAAAITLTLLLGYAAVVTAGPSVWRATLVAVVYLIARLFDHRSLPWQATAVAGACLAAAEPLDVRNAGFLLTFGATAALLETARLVPSVTSPKWRSWLAGSFVASAAVEIALLPIMAATFSRVTVAGLALNVIAVPAMTVVQVAGLVAVCADVLSPVSEAAGWIAHLSAAAIVESSKLVDRMPWVSARVPPPAPIVIGSYYAGVAAALFFPQRWQRLAGQTCVAVMALLIVTGARPRHDPPGLRLTMLDVGQAEAMVLQVQQHAVMIDTGGSPFGASGVYIGPRVVEPALWARGVTSLEALLLTHGDPDHTGGAVAVLDDFSPSALWQGIPVPRAMSLQDVLARASASGAVVSERHAGEELRIADARIVVLHPPVPDWERQKVRNDDSVVLEVIYGDVALLLTGDISAEIERAIAPRLVSARTRILKVAHHGSRTSTSRELLDAWRPQIAIISCGRANPFGHPAAEVIARLEAAGTRIYRTDLDGEITVDTDGQHVVVGTFTGGTP